MRRILGILAAVALLVVVLVVGLRQASDGDGSAKVAAPAFDLGAARRELAGAPAPLASLYRQANALLPGGRRAFDARVDDLRGHPVVVNKWASWCVPCRAEFPVFQAVARERGTRVAFVGVNGTDKRRAAQRFLASRPLPFPSYEDPGETIARAIRAPGPYPITVFLDARGRSAFIHQGAYRSAGQLEQDIDRYLQP